ncbi:MAG: DUF4332 domain-containing protein [Bacteroidales bacterium]|nr:DUF4332 domain-containing protein [Bacteroidales bacterium]
MKSFSPDPDRISLEEFRELTAGRKLLPGRLMLGEQMEERFKILKGAGIQQLGDLLRVLGSGPKIRSFSLRTGLAVDYLILLKREAGSYLARPCPLSGFPGIPFEYVELLKSRGIRHSKDLFEQVQTARQQERMAESTGIPSYRIRELLMLCDISRITGVGGVFARIVYEAGIRSVEEFARTPASEQLSRYQAVIKKYKYPAGKLGEEDIRYGIHYARVLAAFDNKQH